MTVSPPSGEAFLSYAEKLFSISLTDIKGVIKDFHAEMEKGLLGHESSLKMLPSYVDRPTGSEKGRFIALDLGGSNFRVLAVELDGKGKIDILAVSKFAIQKKVMQGTGVQLFDFIAGCIDRFLTRNNMDRKRAYDLAFTFSFPVEQTDIAAGKLIVWTKGFTSTGVEGKDIVTLLNQALRRRKIRDITVTALANDTVGTLMARAYKDPTCDMGVILGTGTNACYREKRSNIRKLKGVHPEGHMIINMEWGNFDKVRRTSYDTRLDEASVNPGAMYFEKMVSGMYLGEITRHVLVDAMARGLVFSNAPGAVESFGERDSLKTEHMSLIERDGTTDLREVEGFFNTRGISNATLDDRALLKHVCQLVAARSARLSAAAVSAVIAWMDPEPREVHTVAIDGSLFEKYPGFETRMTDVLKELYGETAENIRLVHSKDGSGKGAAVMAAVAASAAKEEPMLDS
jgi:hexokinase